MKEFINIVKTLWQNKRTRALAILIIYFIFFLFVFSIISPSNSVKDNVDDNENNIIEESTKDEFYYLNNIQIINHSAYDVNNNIVLQYNQDLVNCNKIYNIVKNSTLAATNYIENTNTYYISIKDYERIINNTTVEIEGNIKITISSNNIILDFTEYYGYTISMDIRS